MKLYLIRHGETKWNKEKRLQGRADIPLDETGIEQAKRLHDEISDLDFDICISSPLKRALETARIAMDGKKCDIITDERIIERNFGEYDGMIVNDWAEFAKGFDTWDRRMNWSERGFEPAKTVLARSKEFLDDIRKKYPSDYRIAIVAHGNLLKALHYNIVGYTDETNFHELHFKNAEMKEYEV